MGGSYAAKKRTIADWLLHDMGISSFASKVANQAIAPPRHCSGIITPKTEKIAVRLILSWSVVIL